MPRPRLAFFVLAGGAPLLTITAAPSSPAIRFREAAAAGGLVFRQRAAGVSAKRVLRLMEPAR